MKYTFYQNLVTLNLLTNNSVASTVVIVRQVFNMELGFAVKYVKSAQAYLGLVDGSMYVDRREKAIYSGDRIRELTTEFLAECNPDHRQRILSALEI